MNWMNDKAARAGIKEKHKETVSLKEHGPKESQLTNKIFF